MELLPPPSCEVILLSLVLFVAVALLRGPLSGGWSCSGVGWWGEVVDSGRDGRLLVVASAAGVVERSRRFVDHPCGVVAHSGHILCVDGVAGAVVVMDVSDLTDAAGGHRAHVACVDCRHEREDEV